MGFYIRKSKKVGPFRFNLSKSGIGTSVGVRGFRVGTGPRGKYVHAGRNGLYYRASLGASRRQPQSVAPFAVGFVLGRLLFWPLLVIGILLLVFAWKALLVWSLIITAIVLVRRYMRRRGEGTDAEYMRQVRLTARADFQHELTKQGDPAGTYGLSTAPLDDAEVAFAEESVGTTFNMFAEDPTPRGVWVIAKAIMTVGGFTEQRANSIIDYQFAEYCPSALPVLKQARQALADPGNHQLDRPLVNVRRFNPLTDEHPVGLELPTEEEVQADNAPSQAATVLDFQHGQHGLLQQRRMTQVTIQAAVEAHTGTSLGTSDSDSIASFGPIQGDPPEGEHIRQRRQLLLKALGLNSTQESTLRFIFHWADQQKLALLYLEDLRAVIAYLISDDGKAELKTLGRVSPATAKVILRGLVNLEDEVRCP
jgi:hypothetical protein